MKKLLLFLIIMIILSVAAPSKAADITIGASTWYTAWKIEDGEKIDPAFLYGPALAVKINDDFVINSIFLYGKFNVTQTGFSYTYDRYDSDTSLGYRLNNYLKLFGGLKFMGYKADLPGATSFDYKSYGPAAGLSGVFPIADDFFLLANASGMYLWSNSSSPGTSDTKGNVYGYNTSASFAYYIAPASVTLSLGGRYQAFTMHDDDGDTKIKFYGVTASATYTFGI